MLDREALQPLGGLSRGGALGDPKGASGVRLVGLTAVDLWELCPSSALGRAEAACP